MRRGCWSELWTLAIALVPGIASAQQMGTITGRVTDEAGGAPLSAVRVSIAATGRDTRTDDEGRFVLTNVAAGSQEVRANRIGYAQRTRAVTVVAGSSVTVDISLLRSTVRLDAVVVSAVTGQAERKRELGSNTATIQVDEMAKGPITKVADILTGRTAGVSLQGVAGTTGTSQRIRIRGANSLSLSNEPLIFVDGVRFDNTSSQQASGNPRAGIAVGGQDFSRLNDINPEDIESVEVLKGPAASALYGTAAANGVLLITTKRGTSGAPQWRGYAEYGSIKDATDYPDVFFTYQRNTPGPVFRPDGQINDASFDNVVTSCSNRVAAGGTCRQDETVRFNPLTDSRTSPFQTGSRRKLGLSVSGGSDAVTYFLSADKEDEEGVISYNDLDKTALRANFTAALNPKAELRLTSSYTASNLTVPGGDNNIFSPLIGALLGSPGFVPDADGNPSSGQYGFGLTNRELSQYIVGSENDRFVLGLSGNYRPLAWLKANANAGLDYYTQASKQTVQPGEIPIGSPYDEGFRDSRAGQSYLYTGNASATATFNPTPTILSTTTVGGNYQRDYSTLVTCFGAGIVSGSASCSASTSLFAVTENFYEVITIGGLLQQGIAFGDRLFLNASVRGDDNSAFGTDFGFIFYPAASVSWVVSEESFFPQLRGLSNLRLRTAFGTSGLRPDFRQAQFLNTVVSVQDASSELAAVTVRSTGNESLKPERTTEFEVGFDAGLFDERLSFDFTYFNKRSRDALIARDLAPSFGLTSDDVNSGSIFQNLGEIRNSGTELGLNLQAFDTDRARLDLRLSATTIDNEISDLGAGVEPIAFNRNTQQHIAGYPAGAYFQLPYTYDDANDDGKLSASEVTIDDSRFTVLRLKNRDGSTRLDTIPEVFYGQSLATNSQSLSASLTLFRFVTLSTLFDRRAGFKQLNDTESFRCGIADSRRNSTGQGGCIATGDPNASLDEQARFIADRFLGTTAGYIEDGEFIKWREFAIAVGIPPRLSRGFRALDGATLTFAGRNLKTWTDYSGFDPESNETGGDTNFSQGEFNTQPPVRYFTLRLDLNF